MSRYGTGIEQRLQAERGTLRRQGRRALALVYPSPYSVGMASLGFQTVYRRINSLDDTVAERAILPDDETTQDAVDVRSKRDPACFLFGRIFVSFAGRVSSFGCRQP